MSRKRPARIGQPSFAAAKACTSAANRGNRSRNIYHYYYCSSDAYANKIAKLTKEIKIKAS